MGNFSKYMGAFLVLSLLFLAQATEAFYPRNKVNRLPLHVLSLYTPEMLRPKITKKQLEAKCPVKAVRSVTRSCRKRVIAEFTQVIEIPVFERPSFQSNIYGKIRVLSPPFQRMRFIWEPRLENSETGRVVEFFPDITCEFRSSDCVAEHTVLDRKGNWLLIPEGPFPGAAWINFLAATEIEPRLRSIAKLGRLFTVGRSVRATMEPQGKNDFIYSGTEVFIKRVESGKLLVRLALPGDRICRPKDHAFGEDPQEYAIYFSELYSGKGQLRLSPTYPNYCEKKPDSELPLYKP